jgi:hypothetical protein
MIQHVEAKGPFCTCGTDEVSLPLNQQTTKTYTPHHTQANNKHRAQAQQSTNKQEHKHSEQTTRDKGKQPINQTHQPTSTQKKRKPKRK